jgi:hypothetical protein
VLTFIGAGQKVLATGRNEESTWLRIHYPSPGRPEAWVEAGQMTVDGSVTGLPVAECIPELAIAPPSLGPEESMTAVKNNPPSAAPTSAPTPTPTATPPVIANTRPNVANLTATTRQISFDTGSYCPNAIKSVTFRVKATDNAGVTGVTLSWREPGASTFAETAMSRASGTSRDGIWQASLNTAANGIDKAGNLAYFATARDAAGATRRIPASTSNAIAVKVCQNTGPAFSAVASGAGATLFWDPLFVGNCQTASNITAAIKDVDGIQSATLFFRRPGSASFASKPMVFTANLGKYFANLDTLGDDIGIPNPPTGTLRWYIRAVDKKGKAAQTVVRSMTIRRCDSEAQFFVNSLNAGQPTNCSPQFTIGWQFSVTDPDELVRTTVRYTIQNTYTGPGGGSRTTATVGANVKNGRFFITSNPISSNTFYGNNQVTWTATTRDLYGGTSTDSGKGGFTVLGCIG